MSLGMRSRLKRWRFRKTSYHGEPGYEKPQISKHVSEARRPEVIASELDERPATLATDDSVALPMMYRLDGEKVSSTVIHSMSETLPDAEMVPQASKGIQSALEADLSLLSMEGSEKLLSTNSDAASLGNNSESLPVPSIKPESTEIPPPHGGGLDGVNSSMSIRNNPLDGHMIILSDLVGDAQTTESVADELYQPESVLDKQDHQPHLPGNPAYPEPILDKPDYQEFGPDGQSHPQPVLDKQNCSERTSEGSHHQNSAKSIQSQESLKSRDQQPQLRREARLQRLRWRNLKTRALVYEKRSELRQLRFEIGDADAKFVKLSRERWIHESQEYWTLESSFKKMQATRDAYGPLEEAYNTLEERLDREEYEITELEEKLLKNSLPIPESYDGDLNSLSNSSDEGDSETSEVITEHEHPLYQEYMSRLGDANLRREAYSDLVAEHESLLQALEVSQRYGHELQPGDQTTLAMFYAKEPKFSEELRKTEADVEHLRLECIREGLLGAGEGEDDENDILQTSDGSLDPRQAEYKTYSHLLEQPGELEDEKRSKALLSDFKQGDTGDRITRWLLHKLRSSCSEVELLARFTDGMDRTVDTEKWQEEVLYFWFVDSANLPPSAYELEPTLTASSPLTDPNRVSRKRFGEKQLIQLVVRSSSLSHSLEFGLWLKLARMKGRSAITT